MYQQPWFRDARTQKLLLNQLDSWQGRRAIAHPAKKPLPPVNRPGTVQPKGLADYHALKTHEQQLSRTGSVKDAARLLIGRRSR
jgi:hypothetical protein